MIRTIARYVLDTIELLWSLLTVMLVVALYGAPLWVVAWLTVSIWRSLC